MRRFAVAACAGLLVCSVARAAVIDSVSITRRGSIVELHFAARGKAPGFRLSPRGRELWIELENVRLEMPPRPLFGREVAPLQTLRAIDPGGAHSRIVVAVSGATDYAAARLPHEILLRLAPAGSAPDIAAPLVVRAGRRRARQVGEPLPASAASAREISSPGPAAMRAGVSGPLRPLRGGPLVMIDPGHGGFDPGTRSRAGVEEKDLALEIARAVVDALQAKGVRAQLTRDGDYFVPLAERTAMANRADADLFVSVHLNWSANPGAQGVEAYYLNNTTDRATIRLARMENGAPAYTGARRDANLNYILADLLQNYKASEAAELARMIDEQTVADVNSQFGLNVNALGARRGPFFVLVGARMPAVLVECGFLSNPDEAARLAQGRYQQIFARALAAAVVRYLSAGGAVGTL